MSGRPRKYTSKEDAQQARLNNRRNAYQRKKGSNPRSGLQFLHYQPQLNGSPTATNEATNLRSNITALPFEQTDDHTTILTEAILDSQGRLERTPNPPLPIPILVPAPSTSFNQAEVEETLNNILEDNSEDDSPNDEVDREYKAAIEEYIQGSTSAIFNNNAAELASKLDLNIDLRERG